MSTPQNPTAEVQPDARLEKRTRRYFSAAHKERLLAEFELLGHGEKGAWLRRQSLYAAQLSDWRRQLREHGLQGLDPRSVAASRFQRPSASWHASSGRTRSCASACAWFNPWSSSKKTLASGGTGCAGEPVMTVLQQRPAHVPKGRAMAALGISRARAYPDRRRSRHRPSAGRRRALSPSEREQALAVLHCERFCDQPPRQVYAALLSEGQLIASVSTLYRLLRAQGESGERRAQRPPQHHTVPRLFAQAPNQVWTWDITKLPTLARGIFLNLYLILDPYSRYVVSWMVSRKENAGLASHLFTRALTRHNIDLIP